MAPEEECAQIGCMLAARVHGLCGGHYHVLAGEPPPDLQRAAGRPPGGAMVPAWLDLDELARVDPGDDAWYFGDLPCGQVPFSTFSRYRRAARICAGCPHRLPCLARWLHVVPPSADEDTGTYVGGTTPSERRAIRRQLTEQAA